jgi:hypothetical protein
MLSGPFMSMFSNKLELAPCMHVLDRTILLGSQALTSIVKNVYAKSEAKILLKCSKDVHPAEYMFSEMFIEAI